MWCTRGCLVATVLLIASASSTYAAGKHEVLAEFEATLDPELARRYKAIVRERGTIYAKGLGMGLAIAAATLLLGRKAFKFSGLGAACVAVAAVMVTSILFYLLHPKSDYMVRHLEEEEQRTAWLKVHRHFQTSYVSGLVLGCASAAVLAGATCS
mgnify:CR=1 FL=1